MGIRSAGIDERALLLGKSNSLAGIIAAPAQESVDTALPALIILNAGLVHRVGPNRLHVKVARRLAERGFVSVRFDLSGIGESLPRPDHLPYTQSAVLEVKEVMDAVTDLTGIRSFCLMGLSSGALVSLDTALTDDRVIGAAIVNPHGFADSAVWGAHVENLSESQIYRRNLLDLHSWARLLTGKTNYRRLAETVWYRISQRNTKSDDISLVVNGMRPRLEAFLGLGINILLLFSEKDRSIVNFDEILGNQWRQQLRQSVEMVILPEANHTFAGPVQLERAVASIDHWMTSSWTLSGGTEIRTGMRGTEAVAGAPELTGT